MGIDFCFWSQPKVDIFKTAVFGTCAMASFYSLRG